MKKDLTKSTKTIIKIIGYLSLIGLVIIAIYRAVHPDIITIGGNTEDISYQIILNVLITLSSIAIIPLILFYICLPFMFPWISYKASIILLFFTGFSLLIFGGLVPKSSDSIIFVQFVFGSIVYIITGFVTLIKVYPKVNSTLKSS